MSLQTRLTALATAVGEDIKELDSKIQASSVAAKATRLADFNIASAVPASTVVIWDTKLYDPKDIVNLSDGMITIPEDGEYIATAQWYPGSNVVAGASTLISMIINHSTLGRVAEKRGLAGGSPNIVNISAQFQAVAGSKIYVTVGQNSGTTKANGASTAGAPNYLAISRVNGPKGDKGDTGGIDIVTTSDWDTALAPGFYRSSWDIEEKTINGPGDTLNPPSQAGIVSVHESGELVQRVWDLQVQRAYMRYRDWDGTWTAWIADLERPNVRTESGFGGPTPYDGEERYFQSTAMKALGVMWRFRYNAASSSDYKWEFVGGAPVYHRIATSEMYSNATLGDLATVGPSLTLPLLGDYLIRWGAFASLAVASTAAEAYVYPQVAGAYPASHASFIATALYGGGSVSSEVVVPNVAAASLVRLKYATQNSLQFTFARRWLSIQPVRVIGL